MSTDFIKTFVSELITKYGDNSIQELQNYINEIKISNKEETTLHPFFKELISEIFEEYNPSEYRRLENFCQNVRIVKTNNQYYTYYFPNISEPIIIGKRYASWAKHGDLLKKTEFYCKYLTDIEKDDANIYNFMFIKDEEDIIENYDEGDFDNIEKLIWSSYGKFTYQEDSSDYSEETDYDLKKILFTVLFLRPVIQENEDWCVFVNTLCKEIANIGEWINEKF